MTIPVPHTRVACSGGRTTNSWLHGDGEQPGQQQQEQQVPSAVEEPVEDLRTRTTAMTAMPTWRRTLRVCDSRRHDAGGAPCRGVV